MCFGEALSSVCLVLSCEGCCVCGERKSEAGAED